VSRKKLQEELEEAKRWQELVEKCEEMVDRYGQPTLIQMAETFGCSLNILHNIGDSVEGLKLIGAIRDQRSLRMVRNDR
jgi:hypothetical protein